MFGHPLSRLTTFTALASLTAAALPAQTVSWTRFGSDRIERFGGAVSYVDDWNGDGVADFAVGAPVANARPNPHQGAVRIYAGATLNFVKEITGIGGPLFGTTLDSAGDFDGDGTLDLLVGDPSDNNDDGAAFVVSGTDQSVLATFRGGSLRSGYATTIATLGDVDGDGTPDYAFGSPENRVSAPLSFGLVEMRSGKTGAVLFSRTGFGDPQNTGAIVANAGDFDHDSVSDLLVGEIDGLQPPLLTVRVYSGATRAQLLVKTIGKNEQITGGLARLVGDLDNDGADDLLVVANALGPFGVVLNVVTGISSGTSAELFNFTGPVGDDAARSCSTAGDVDGDGIDDFVIGRPGNGLGAFTVYSGATRAKLLELQQNQGLGLGAAVDARADIDNDGVNDLIIGCSGASTAMSSGEAQVRTLPSGTVRRRHGATLATNTLHGGACLFDDIDGDGIAEVLAGVSTRLDRGDGVAVLAGVDGHELKRFAAGANDVGGTLLRLPDVNGDGLGDFAVASALLTGVAGTVEIRSGLDGAVIRTFTDSVKETAFGRALAVGTQASGAIHLGIGTPLSDLLRTDGGKFEVFDVMTGALVCSAGGNFAGEQFGATVSFLGDINADGKGDWAVGAPFNGVNGVQAGRIAMINGTNGGQIRAVRGVAAGDKLGMSVATVADANADGVNEVLIGAPGVGANDEGQLLLASGKTAAILKTVNGATAGAIIGEDVESVATGNEDAVTDFLTTWAGRKRVDLFTGATANLMQPMIGLPVVPRSLGVAPAALAGLIGNKPGALLVLGATDDKTGGTAAGAVSLVKLDDVYLQVSPTSGLPNDVVTAFMRGGKPGAALVLLLIDIDGTPVSVTLDAATFDANGAHSAAGTIPPGLSGQVWTVMGFAIGVSGKVIDTTPATFTFN